MLVCIWLISADPRIHTADARVYMAGCYMSDLPLHDTCRDMLFFSMYIEQHSADSHIYIRQDSTDRRICSTGYSYMYGRLLLIVVHIQQDARIYMAGCYISDLLLHNTCRDMPLMSVYVWQNSADSHICIRQDPTDCRIDSQIVVYIEKDSIDACMFTADARIYMAGCYMSDLPLHDTCHDMLFFAGMRGLVILLIRMYVPQESTDFHVNTKTGCYMSDLPLHDTCRDMLFMAEMRTAEVH